MTTRDEYRRWLREMYRAMDFLMCSGAWSAVNEYMRCQQLSNDDDPRRSIAILRFMSDAPRERVPAWEELLWRVDVTIKNLGLDPRLLRGLTA